MTTITAEVVTIGDEILYGQITDTNTQYLSENLAAMGIVPIRKTSVGDSREAILQMLTEAAQRAHVIIITGGLGPTKDDITKQTLADFFGVGMVSDADTLARVTDFFAKRNRPMLEANIRQADVPENCVVLANEMGTAPGMWFVHHEKIIVSLPGVPYEMKHLWATQVAPRLKQQFILPKVEHYYIQTVGIGESFLAEKIKHWESQLPKHIKLAYLPSLGIVKLRLTACNSPNAKHEILTLAQKVLPIINEYVFAQGEQPIKLEQALGDFLTRTHLTISTAESCTGGYIAHLFTSIPGSSAFFKGSAVVYANEAKQNMLDVNPDLIEKYGAVSEQVAMAMAINARQKFNTTLAIATTGIAGPTGGSSEKPVGTVWIGLADESGATAMRFNTQGTRENNVKLFSVHALNVLRKILVGYGFTI